MLYRKNSAGDETTGVQFPDTFNPTELSNRLAEFNQKIKAYKENRNIRYSIADTDSEGNALTDGQKEFFKDSKAVSQDGGELLRLYHGTAKAGFTQFRTERMSEYHRGGIWT